MSLFTNSFACLGSIALAAGASAESLPSINHVASLGPTKFVITADERGVLEYNAQNQLIYHRLDGALRVKVTETSCFPNCVATNQKGQIFYTQPGTDSADLMMSDLKNVENLGALPRFSGAAIKDTKHELTVCAGEETIYIRSAWKRNDRDYSSALSYWRPSAAKSTPQTIFYERAAAINAVSCDPSHRGVYFTAALADPNLADATGFQSESIYFVASDALDAPPRRLFNEPTSSDYTRLVDTIAASASSLWSVINGPNWAANPFKLLVSISPEGALQNVSAIETDQAINILHVDTDYAVYSKRDASTYKIEVFSVQNAVDSTPVKLSQNDFNFAVGTFSAGATADTSRVLFAEEKVAERQLVWVNINGTQRRTISLSAPVKATRLSSPTCAVVLQDQSASGGISQIKQLNWNTESQIDLLGFTTPYLKATTWQSAADHDFVVISADIAGLNRYLLYKVDLPACSP